MMQLWWRCWRIWADFDCYVMLCPPTCGLLRKAGPRSCIVNPCRFVEVYLQVAKRITKQNTRIPRCVQKIRRKPVKLGRFLIPKYYLYDGTPYILLLFTIHADIHPWQRIPFLRKSSSFSRNPRNRGYPPVDGSENLVECHQLRL